MTVPSPRSRPTAQWASRRRPSAPSPTGVVRQRRSYRCRRVRPCCHPHSRSTRLQCSRQPQRDRDRRDRRRHERRRVDVRDGAVGAVRHPDRARTGCDRRRSLPTPTVPSSARKRGRSARRPRRDRRSRATRTPRASVARRRRRSPRSRAAASKRPVVPRVDLRDAALAAGHPDGVLRGGEGRRRVADRNRGQRLPEDTSTRVTLPSSKFATHSPPRPT